MQLNFIHDLKDRFERVMAPSPKTALNDREEDEQAHGSSYEPGEYVSVEYQRYHWGSAPGPWY
jgi:hypothetical protein